MRIFIRVVAAWAFALWAGVIIIPALANAGAGYSSAEVCGECHRDIYNSWRKSLHAVSYNNPIFMTAYREAYLETKGEAKTYCLKCHAPTTLGNEDYDVTLSITKEGVTCDFCHTVESVDLGNDKAPFVLDIGGGKRASMKQAISPEHKASYVDWFNKAKMCAGCHEMTNPNGVNTISTYSEWKSSRYGKEGKDCQECHMPEVEGKIVDPGVKVTNSDKFHNHSLSHNLRQMQGAVDVAIKTAKPVAGGRYLVDVIITNVKAGHNIPTGSPSRMLTLEVKLEGAGFTELIQIKEFGKTIVDSDGGALTRDVDAYLRGALLKENSALRPGGSIETRFVFSGSPESGARVTATAYLTYRAVVTNTERMKIMMGSAEKRQ